jgi:hypothetical protein
MRQDQKNLILEAIEAYSLILDRRIEKISDKNELHRRLCNKLDSLQELSMDIVDSDQAYDLEHLMSDN